MRVGALVRVFAVTMAAAGGAATGAELSVSTVISNDPPHDDRFPAKMEVIHVPTGGVEVNGIVYTASGQGPHPTFVLFHGLPGNERNLDVAQAVRRAGWNVVTINYRGSWGSGGVFRFAQNLEDAKAVLAYIRDPDNAKRLGIDTTRIAIGGHSMGGWVTVHTLAADPALLGGITISAADMGGVGLSAREDRAPAVARMNRQRESLVDVTGESMVDELAARADAWNFAVLAPHLIDRRLYMLYSDDHVEADSIALIGAVRAAGGKRVTGFHAATDHSWSDKRIMLSEQTILWLRSLLR